MRSFLMLLVLTNLGYLIWRQGWVIERPTGLLTEEPRAYSPAPQTLELLGELPQERRDLMASLKAAQDVRAGAEQQLAGVQEEAAILEGKIDDNVAKIAEDGGRSTPIAEGEPTVVGQDSPALADEVVVASSSVPWCAIAGAFASDADAAAFVVGLAELEVVGAVEVRQEPVSSTWWVHMPAFASEAAAMALLAELQAKNIDSYYMRSGEMAGGISLGVYSREASAAIAQRQLADRGYTTSVREVARMGDRHYVTFRMSDDALRQAPEWAAFLARAGAIEVSENACETIASENEFP